MKARVRKSLVLCALLGALALTTAVTSMASPTTSQDQSRAANHMGGTITTLWSSAGSSIDPGIDYDQNVIILRLPYHGLVGFARVNGVGGDRVVPDLARAVPKPTDGGKTWTFRLRTGIKFSTGKPVTPRDFLWTFERQYRMNGPATGIYSAIQGTATCIKTPSSCDLSQGVVANDSANTVTFHLSKADPDFLDKLAMTFGAVVPYGTPAKDTGAKPIPATGAYMIKSYTPNQSLVFVRNPQFHSWSQIAAPTGYADQIVMKMGEPVESEVNAVENGQADWMYDTPPNDRLNEIATKYPSQLHLSPLYWEWYMALGTKVAPFNNVKVRQAINLATDRNALIKLYGGPELGTPACQILPKTFPGHVDYCPYTQNPGPGGAGVWKAPDMAKAKQLIAASHTRGMTVKVFTGTDPFSTSVGNYFVSLLNQLGYKGELKRLSGNILSPYVANTKNKVQMSLTFWLPDYSAPANFLTIPAGCAGYQPNSDTNTNWSDFCSPSINRLAERAGVLQLTNPAAAMKLWAKVDHETTDQAPWVPLFVAKYPGFVSKRLGNYQFAPTSWLLLDKAWVH